jgi:hypothetical protein
MFFEKAYPFLIILVLFGCTSIEEDVDKSCSLLDSKLEQIRPELFSEDNGRIALSFYDSIMRHETRCLEGEIGIAIGFDLGHYYYLQQIPDSAIYFYQKALVLAESRDDHQNSAALKTNLGATYLGMGYMRSAAKYFMEARASMEKSNLRDENYWITLINQAVAHIEQEDYSYALDLLDDVDTSYSNTVQFLHALNRAKIAGLMKNESIFLRYIKRSESMVDSVTYYQNIYSEVDIEYSLQFDLSDRLKVLWAEFGDQYNDTYPYFQLLLQRLSLRLHNETIGGEAELDRLSKEVLNKGDQEERINLLSLLIDQARLSNSYKELITLLEERQKLNEEINHANSFSDLKDFYEFSEINKLERSNQKLRREKEVLELKQTNTNYFVLLLVVILLLAIVSIILILVERRRKVAISQVKEALNKELMNQALQREDELKERLSFESNRNTSILAKLSKFQILKKQLDDFLKDMSLDSLDLNDKQGLLKNAEVNLKAFFSNYTDLAVLGMANSVQFVSKEQIQQQFSKELSDLELKVVELILSNFTSKEIALLISKSEKTVEYYRRNIRKKLNLQSGDDMKIALESLFFSNDSL